MQGLETALRTPFPALAANHPGGSIGHRQAAAATSGLARRRMIEIKRVTCGEGIESIKPVTCEIAGGNHAHLPIYEKVDVDSGGGGFRLLAVDDVAGGSGTGQTRPCQTPLQTSSRNASPQGLNPKTI